MSRRPKRERITRGYEREFMVALDRYKRSHHRPFPTCCEVLAVLKSLGYRKVAPKDDKMVT
jgi:hypothetical protein